MDNKTPQFCSHIPTGATTSCNRAPRYAVDFDGGWLSAGACGREHLAALVARQGRPHRAPAVGLHLQAVEGPGNHPRPRRRLKRAMVDRIAMTDFQRIQAQLLARCRLPPASWSKRFAREIGALAQTPDAALSPREAAALERLCWTFRRQLPEQYVPARKPPPAESVPPVEAARQPRRPTPRQAARLAKLERAMRGEW